MERINPRRIAALAVRGWHLQPAWAMRPQLAVDSSDQRQRIRLRLDARRRWGRRRCRKSSPSTRIRIEELRKVSMCCPPAPASMGTHGFTDDRRHIWAVAVRNGFGYSTSRRAAKRSWCRPSPIWATSPVSRTAHYYPSGGMLAKLVDTRQGGRTAWRCIQIKGPFIAA